MPTLLKRLLIAELGLGLFLAALLPFLETGTWQTLASAAAILPVILCVAFWLRTPLSDIALSSYCAIAALLGFGFVALQLITIKSVIVEPTNLVMILESALAAWLFFALRSASARQWFMR